MSVLSFSDEQAQQIMATAAQLPNADREGFLNAIVAQLGPASEPSDAEVTRAVRSAFQLFFKPPSLLNGSARGKYGG